MEGLDYCCDYWRYQFKRPLTPPPRAPPQKMPEKELSPEEELAKIREKQARQRARNTAKKPGTAPSTPREWRPPENGTRKSIRTECVRPKSVTRPLIRKKDRPIKDDSTTRAKRYGRLTDAISPPMLLKIESVS